MPRIYNSIRGNKSLLKKHMMPPDEKPVDVSPSPQAEKPPVTDAGLDDGQGSSSSSSNSSTPVVDDNLILLGLGALILCSVVMVK
mgnify:CR=1